jgi:Na+-translocating ferredoxin:NAD+ oxidoreductase subunit A
MELLALLFGVMIINNFILAKFLGLCSFLGVSRDLRSASSMGLAVTFVTTLASAVTWALNEYVLEPCGVMYLQTIVFILVIAALVQFVEAVIKKVSPPLQRALGIYLPLITTNCAVLGVCLLIMNKDMNLIESVVFGFGGGAGYLLVICMMAGIRERLDLNRVPLAMQGMPINFIVGCLMALSFFGFQGLFAG